MNSYGCAPGELVVVSALPNEGKTRILLHHAREDYERYERVLFVSDTPSDTILKRFCSGLSGISMEDIEQGKDPAVKRQVDRIYLGLVGGPGERMFQVMESPKNPKDIVTAARNMRAESMYIDDPRWSGDIGLFRSLAEELNARVMVSDQVRSMRSYEKHVARFEG